MNRRYTLIIILIFVALAIMAYLQRDAEPIDFTDGGPTPTAAPILEVESADVQEVEVADGSQSYTLVRVAGGWEIDEESLSEFVDGTIGRMANPTVLRSLPEDVDPSDFGFDSPTMTLTLKTAGGDSHSLVVGDKHPVDPQYYMRLAGDERIVIVSSSDLDSLMTWFSSPPFVPTPTPEVSEEEEADAADADTADTDESDADLTSDDADEEDADAEDGADEDGGKEDAPDAEEDESTPTPTPTLAPEPDEG
jgi:hypothetical protein